MDASNLPRRVQVAEVLSGRYPPGEKPLSWDKRSSGVEEIRTAEGDTVRLFSSGGQSTPAPGWELILMKPKDDNSVLWTLYGLGK